MHRDTVNIQSNDTLRQQNNIVTMHLSLQRNTSLPHKSRISKIFYQNYSSFTHKSALPIRISVFYNKIHIFYNDILTTNIVIADIYDIRHPRSSKPQTGIAAFEVECVIQQSVRTKPQLGIAAFEVHCVIQQSRSPKPQIGIAAFEVDCVR